MIHHFYIAQVKQWVYNLLRAKYEPNEPAIERLCAAMHTERDFKELCGLFQALYESGFADAIEQQREALAKRGLEVKVSRPEEPQQTGRIFKQ